MNFKANLKEIRIERQKKQIEVAEAMNVVPATYSSWETGKTEPDLNKLTQLADYFQVTTDYLLGREDYGTGIIEIRQPARENKVPDKDLDERLKFIEEQFLLLNIENQMQVLGFIQALKYKQQKKN